MNEDETEDEHSDHHRKRGPIVRSRRGNETLVHRMLERMYGNLAGDYQVVVASPSMVHLEPIHPIHIRDLECHLIGSIGALTFHLSANEGIDPNELNLDRRGVVRNPFPAVIQRLDLHREARFVHDGVRATVLHIRVPENSGLLEDPASEGFDEFLISALGSAQAARTLDGSLQVLVTEQGQGTEEQDSGIVTSLQRRNQSTLLPSYQGSRSNCFRRGCTVGCRGTVDHSGDQRVLAVSDQTDAVEEDGVEFLGTDHRRNVENLSAVDHDRRVIAIVNIEIVVVMIENSIAFGVYLEAAFSRELLHHVSNIGVDRCEDVSSIIDELREHLGIDVSSEFCKEQQSVNSMSPIGDHVWGSP